jgi:hypothetical protein
MRRYRIAILTLSLAGALAAMAAPAQAQTLPTLVAVRAAHHPGFDRITFEFRDGRPEPVIRYVDQLTEDGSGRPVSLAGAADLEVVFHGVNAHTDGGAPTVSPRRFAPGLPVLKEVAQIGDFEAVVSYGLGLDHQVPFTVSRLSNPSRVVIDLQTGAGPGVVQGPGALPFTGSNDLPLFLTGLGLLAAGGAALLLGRRTRNP